MMTIRPKKSLGQHFLHSPSALRKIIEAAEIHPGETVLEIGPGTGILTRALIDAGARVIAVEKDERATTLLSETFKNELTDTDNDRGTGKLTLINGDILDPTILNTRFPILNSSYALVANIPYYITGAILEKFLEHAPRPSRMVLLVQKEVAERIVARDGKESILSISVKAFGEPRMVAKVPRGAFVPPPSVDSAILAIDHISDQRFTRHGVDVRKFFDIVRSGFAHKRKFLIKNLDSADDSAAGARAPSMLRSLWQKLGVDEKVRAEDMTVDQWIAVAAHFQSSHLL